MMTMFKTTSKAAGGGGGLKNAVVCVLCTLSLCFWQALGSSGNYKEPCTDPPIEPELPIEPGFPDPACNANPACATGRLSGNCCPSSEGEYLACCYGATVPPEVEPELPIIPGLPAACSENKWCRGLENSCCPNYAGEYLDCCFGPPEIPDSCKSNPDCSGLVGECCPTIDGWWLECCQPGPELPIEIPEACASNENCVGLSGLCCPTVDGWVLNCCLEPEAPIEPSTDPPSLEPSAEPSSELSSEPTEKPSEEPPELPIEPEFPPACIDNPACVTGAGRPLRGNCCPSDQGTMLDCCYGVTIAPEIEPEEYSAVPSGAPSPSVEPELPIEPAPTKVPSTAPSDAPSPAVEPELPIEPPPTPTYDPPSEEEVFPPVFHPSHSSKSKGKGGKSKRKGSSSSSSFREGLPNSRAPKGYRGRLATSAATVAALLAL